MSPTGFQWATLILGIMAFFITWTGLAIGWGRLIEAVKADTTKKVAISSKDITAKIDALRTEFFKEQQSQDHNFGEVGSAVRQYIANVEKEMHEIEIWGRDNFVLKDDFIKATDRLEEAIKDMAADIKSDFRDLTKKIDERH